MSILEKARNAMEKGNSYHPPSTTVHHHNNHERRTSSRWVSSYLLVPDFVNFLWRKTKWVARSGYVHITDNFNVFKYSISHFAEHTKNILKNMKLHVMKVGMTEVVLSIQVINRGITIVISLIFIIFLLP